ncbi:YdcF family protein [Leptospira langatensis]|uniref:YdcF family protein n=1 Tax=Leptospira langatensis TaxID=2484983 RepID=A0A5F1ZSZ2_9LEPT|nr:YdcF family protein [Leptospira langatensis]TGK00340.1 YdcF family protein [Leptospira langatensis]TGL41161.1 YdcF family protein [Leptospira langatensis]
MDTLFFAVSKLAGAFLFPLPACLLLLIFFGLRLPKFKHKVWILLPTLFLWVCSTDSFSQWMIYGLEENHPPVKWEKLQNSDAILVLGGAVDNLALHNEQVQLTSAAERMTDAVFLFQKKKAPRIVFTGGSGNLFFQTRKESDSAALFFRSLGVPNHSIFLETESRNTKENAEMTAELFRKKGWKSAILITSAFHMERSILVFQKTGLDIRPWPTDYRSRVKVLTIDDFVPSSQSLENTSIAWKERIGLFVYKLRESISTFLPLRFRYPWSKNWTSA